MMKNVFVKVVALVLVLATLSGVFAITASAATWRTGNIPQNYKNSGYTTVYLSNTKKDAKIKIHTYYTLFPGGTGYEGKSRVYITMRDTNGRWIWGGEIDTGRNGKTMNLGKDHYAYRIYIREVSLPGYKYFESYFHPSYWAIECTKNCYI